MFLHDEDRPLALETYDRRPIANHVSNPLNEATRRQRVHEFEDFLTSLRITPLVLGTPDSTYNCGGLTFASSRAWVDPDQFGLIIDGDSYVFVAEGEERIGDLVTWSDDAEFTHVGLVVGWQELRFVGVEAHNLVRLRESYPMIMSKWGQCPLCLHPVNCVPDEYGTNIRFWRIARG